MSTSEPLKDSWNLEDVTSNYDPHPERDPEGGIVSPTGYLQSNRGGAELWDRVVVQAGLDPEKAAIKFMVNREKKIAVGYPFLPGLAQAKGIAPVRRYKNGTMSFHLRGVFKEAKELKPMGRVKATFSADVDPDGKPCLLINLGLAVAHHARKRTKDEAAAAKDEDEA